MVKAMLLPFLCVLIFSINLWFANGSDSIGVCYGLLGNNLPPPAEAVQLIRSLGISKIRLYAPNEDIINSVKNTDVEVSVGVPNELLQMFAQDQAFAGDWVGYHVLRHRDVKFRYIIVGNEVFPGKLAQYVGPAMQHVYNTLKNANVQDRIKVTTAVHTAVMGTSSPPSQGSFSDAAKPFMSPVLGLLKSFNSPLLINVYPYFAYTGNRAAIQAPYALFTANWDVVTDPNSHLKYRNLFDAMVDSIYSALERIGFGDVPLVISETGWPSGGGDADVTTIENAGTFNNNLVRHVTQGTPKRPGSIETYIFALFNENQKSGDETEKHFGLFYPNKQPVYPFSLS